MAIKLTSFSEQGLVEFLQSHRESQLSIKVNLKSNQDISYLKIIEAQFSSLIHLTEFSIIIPHYCALTNIGYNYISNAINQLTSLTKLTIKIDGFLQNEELLLLQNSIQSLVNLQTLIFKVSLQNDVTSSAGKEFVDSLSFLSNLRKLTLVFNTIKKSQMNKGNIHFWNGIQRLQNLEKFSLEVQEQNYGQQDQIELFSLIVELQKLKSFSFIILGDLKKVKSLSLFEQRDHPTTQFVDMIISYVGKMVNLKSLEIDFDQNSEVYFIETQKMKILKKLSNLKYLEKLKIKTIQRELIKNHLKEYADLIQDLKYLKKISILCHFCDVLGVKSFHYLCQSFINLTNMTHLELNFILFEVQNELISDLSISLLNMKNLNSLKLTLAALNDYQSFQLGSSLAQLHNLKQLFIYISSYNSCQAASLIFQNLDGGLMNLKELILRVEEGYQNNHFYQFLHQLINLETLEISKIVLYVHEDFDQLYNSVRSLKQLKTLDISVRILNLNSQSSFQILESTFKELQSLESLKISLNIQNKSDNITKMNILDRLKNLKKLSIKFESLFLNMFDIYPHYPSTHKYLLEEVEVISDRFAPVKTRVMLNTIDSISTNFKKMKKLKLVICLKDYSSKYSKEFGEICSKFANLSTLALQDESSKSSISFYAKSFKKLKGLNSIKLDFPQIKEDDIRQLGKALKKLENLRKIELVTKLNEEDLANFEKELSNLLQYHKKIRVIKIDVKQSNSDCLRFINTISLNKELLNYTEDHLFDLSNEIILDEMNRGKYQKSQEKIEPKDFKLLPNEIKIDIILEGQKGEEHLFLIKNLDNIGLQYLIDLEMKVDKNVGWSKSKGELTVQDISLELDQLNQLRQLTLDLSKLSFTEEQIYYFSHNVEHLINLRYLIIKIDSMDDHFSSLFDGFKHLKELQTFELETKISERAVTSLGNSLKELNNLKVCTLKFKDQSQFGIQGALSLMNGLKVQENMERLILDLHSQGIRNEDREEIEVFKSNFLEKMTRLYQFELLMRLGSQYVNILQLCSSLNQLPYLERLTIELFNNHQQNQEMLDQLITSIDQLIYLRTLNITINNLIGGNNDSPFVVPKSLSQYLNRQLDHPLKIRGENVVIEVFQENNFYLKISSIFLENTIFNFLEDLNETKVITFEYIKNQTLKLLSQIASCPLKKIRIKPVSIFYEENVKDLCTFISKIPNVCILQLNVFISSNCIQDSLSQISNSILQLKNLHTLCLILIHQGNQDQACSEEDLLQVVSKLKNHNKLYEFYLFSSGFQESLNRIIQKKMKRLVQFDASVPKSYQIQNIL